MKLYNLSIAHKLHMLGVIAVISLLATAAFALLQEKQILEKERHFLLQSVVESVHSQVAALYKRGQNGNLSEEEAKTAARQLLRHSRYNQDEYLFITDFSANVILHPIKPELEGKNMNAVKDINGVHLFQKMAKLARTQGHGIVQYHWPKPGTTNPVPKSSYVKAFKPWSWAIGSGIYMDDVTDAVLNQAINFGMIIFGILAFMFAAITLVGRNISRPILDMTSNMGAIADGDLQTDVIATHRGDEIGKMAAAVQVFKDNMIKAKQLSEEQHFQQIAKEEQRQKVEQYIRDFELTVVGVLDGLSSADQSMRKASETVANDANETLVQSSTVASAAEEASTNVETVASAAEELSISINEISRQVSQATSVTERAVTQTEETSKTVSELEANVIQIGEVIDLINNIADQTNLLALNATIEAARAGEAGKGFAVVASEVKNLANQTSKATEDIRQQIENVQNSTTVSVQAIRSVSKTISEINDISTSIASAVEEQGAATREIAQNVEQAAGGTHEVSTSILHVQESAQSADKASEKMKKTSKKLAKQAKKLKKKVATFLEQVRFEESSSNDIVVWDDNLMTGSTQIDEEHKRLCDAVNDLYAAVKRQDSADAVHRHINLVREHCAQHFDQEEVYMRKIGFPGYEDHKAEHEDFLERIILLFDEYESGSEHAGIELLGFLGSLWQNHISTTDRELADYCKHTSSVKMAAE